MPCLFFVYPDRHREKFLVCEPRAFRFRARFQGKTPQVVVGVTGCTTNFFHAYGWARQDCPENWSFPMKSVKIHR